VERELVFSGSCDSCAVVGAGALEALVTVAMCVNTTERLDAGGVGGLDQRSRRTASRFWSVTASASVASGSVLSSSILSSNRTSIVASAWGTSVWTPEATLPSRESVTTEL